MLKVLVNWEVILHLYVVLFTFLDITAHHVQVTQYIDIHLDLLLVKLMLTRLDLRIVIVIILTRLIIILVQQIVQLVVLILVIVTEHVLQ